MGLSRDYTPTYTEQEEISRFVYWQHCRLVFVPQLPATPTMTDVLRGIAQSFYKYAEM
jgi:hypothetical protein